MPETHNGTSFDPATESFAGWVLRVVEGLARYRADRVREAQLHDDQGARDRALAEIAQTTDSVERALIEGAKRQAERDVDVSVGDQECDFRWHQERAQAWLCFGLALAHLATDHVESAIAEVERCNPKNAKIVSMLARSWASLPGAEDVAR